jgi:hypothetical protein
VTPDARVAVLDVADENFRHQLAARVGDFSDGRPDSETDLVFLAAEGPEDLRSLDGLEDSLARDGAVWVVHPKGSKVVREADVLAAGIAVGLVDNKVVSFSTTHTAHRFVIPRARR